MAFFAPRSIRPHRAEHAGAQRFGSSIPNFLSVPATRDWFEKPKRTQDQPAKLTPEAKRWFVKYCRQARLRMQHAR